jgi:hypothetical protein
LSGNLGHLCDPKRGFYGGDGVDAHIQRISLDQAVKDARAIPAIRVTYKDHPAADHIGQFAKRNEI